MKPKVDLDGEETKLEAKKKINSVTTAEENLIIR